MPARQHAMGRLGSHLIFRNAALAEHRFELFELAAAGEIGSLACFHYALMGATWEPNEIEPTARALAGLLKADGCNAALLVPV